MVSGRSRGRGRDFGVRGRGFVGGGRGSYGEADRVPMRKDPGNAGTVDAVFTSSRSGEAEYRAMTHTACEMVWLNFFFFY